MNTCSFSSYFILACDICRQRRSHLYSEPNRTKLIVSGTTMQPCLVCLNFDRLFDHGNRWHVDVRDDLTLEYSLEFEFLQLKLSAQSGCPTCSIVLSGLQLMSRKLFIFEESQQHQGRFILQADSPLEVEVIDPRKNEPVRIQYYTPTGSQSGLYTSALVCPLAKFKLMV
jgi:hypothetical protein